MLFRSNNPATTLQTSVSSTIHAVVLTEVLTNMAQQEIAEPQPPSPPDPRVWNVQLLPPPIQQDYHSIGMLPERIFTHTKRQGPPSPPSHRASCYKNDSLETITFSSTIKPFEP